MPRPQAVKKQKSSRVRFLKENFDKDGRPDDDVRLPQQRAALLAWADRYVAAGCRTLTEQKRDLQT